MADYTVRATRDGRLWFLHVLELDQYTQARRLSEIDEMVRDLIHIVTGDDEGDISLNVHVELPEQVQAARQESERLRKMAEDSNARAAAKSREAARLLRDQGVTVRELGSLFGISYQRAQQLSQAE